MILRVGLVILPQPIDAKSFPDMASPNPIDPIKLDRLAEVAIRVGLQLQPGQDLVLTSPIAALPLVRRIAAHAYKAGAGFVQPIFSDEEITLARYHNAASDSFDRAPAWLDEVRAYERDVFSKRA